jgi:hypothetical protein
LIDGLDESLTPVTEESDNIVSILSNLEGLKNAYFVMTTRDYDNILNKFNKNSLILNISSNKYVNYVNEDVSSFIRLNINKKKLPLEKYQGFTDNMVNQLVKKAQGNFLYIKFVMDAFVEGKINFSQEEVDKIPFGLYDMYSDFFDRMKSQHGENNWGTFYLPIIRTLLVSFEGLNSNELSFFTGIEDNLQQILINLKPFIVLQKLNEDIRKSKSVKYKLYHQSLVEFLKTEYFEGDSQNSFYIPEQRGHKKIVEKYYDKTAGKFNIVLLNEYGLRYLPEHLFALFDYDDPEGTAWYAKLLELAKDKELEEKQRQYFPFETNLPLKTIKRAYEASLEKDDPVSTAEMLLIYANNLKRVFLESPLSILINTNLDNTDVLEKSWRIADLYDEETRVKWYLLIAWYLNCKNKMANAQKMLDRLFGKELVSSDLNVTDFFVYSLYDQYKDKMVKIFNHISNDHIDEISSFFFKNNNLKTGIEILNRIGNEKAKVNIINDLNSNKLDTENSLVAEFIEKCKTSSIDYRSKALSSLAQSLAQSNKIDDAIKAANAIEDSYERSKALSSLAQSLAQSNKPDDALKAAKLFDDAIRIANTIENSYDRSIALSSLAQFLVQSKKLEDAMKAANAIEDSYQRSDTLSSLAQSLAESNKLDEAIKAANAIEDSYERSKALSSLAQFLVQANKLEEANKAANAMEDSYERSETLSSIAQSLAQSNKIDDAAQIANSIKNSYSRSEALSKIIAKKLEIGDNFSNMNLQEIIYKVSNLSELSIASLETQKLWNHIMKQCIGYPEIAYNVCLLVAERYPRYSKEIADIILKYNF